MDETAALQLFAHLEGEALNVAPLMSEGERANREGLSSYYNSPGRLAVFRRKFEQERIPPRSPQKFWRSRDLEIWLHASGNGWSGTDLLRTNVVVDCGLWRYLDSVPPDTLIQEMITAGCGRVTRWVQKKGSSPGTDMYRGHTVVASDSCVPGV